MGFPTGPRTLSVVLVWVTAVLVLLEKLEQSSQTPTRARDSSRFCRRLFDLLSQWKNSKLVGLPFWVSMKKFKVFWPWLLGKRVETAHGSPIKVVMFEVSSFFRDLTIHRV